jgi:hypothetical protein
LSRLKLYSRKATEASRLQLERQLGFELKEHSWTQVQDFFARTRDIEWDPEAGPTRPLTDEESRFAANEILMSRISFDYFCRRYCNLLTDTKEIKPLIPWPSQTVLFETLGRLEDEGQRKMKVILLKSRQIGGTAGSEALIAHLTFLNPNTQAIIASDHPDNSQKLWQTLLRMYNHLPGWMQPHADAQVKATHFHMDKIESDIIVGSGNQKTTLGQGMNVDAAHLTEVSTWEHPEYIDMDLMPAFDSSKKHHSFIILESTGAGAMGNWFHDQYQSAMNGTSEFVPLFIAWFMRPGWRKDATGLVLSETTLAMADRVKRETSIELDREQMAFYQIKRRELEAKGQLGVFFQEFPSTMEEAWQTGFESAVPIEIRSKLRDGCAVPAKVYSVDAKEKKLTAHDPIEFVRRTKEKGGAVLTNGKLMVWEGPRRDAAYIVAVDVSYGIRGGDNSAVEVLRIGTRGRVDEQVAEWCGNVSPLDVAGVVEIVGKLYSDADGLPARVAIEVNPGSPGIVTQTELRRRNYPHFYRWSRPLKQGMKPSTEIGWWTTTHTRPLITEMGVDYLKKGWLKINSPYLVDELTTFVDTHKVQGQRKLEHAPGHHDDRVMALFIALYIAHEFDSLQMASEREKAAADPKVRTRFPSAAEMGVDWETYSAMYEQFLDEGMVTWR